VGDHERGELDVLVGEGLERAGEQLEHDVDRAQRALLEFAQLVLEVRPAGWAAAARIRRWHVPACGPHACMPARIAGRCESENSWKSPVITNATCSPMSTALSAIRASARATSTM